MSTDKDQEQQDREASHVAYAVSVAIVNSRFTDEERALVQQLVTEAAQQLSIKMTLMLQQNGESRPRFSIGGYIKTSNSGQRKLELNLAE
jgi:hypothetical protein